MITTRWNAATTVSLASTHFLLALLRPITRITTTNSMTHRLLLHILLPLSDLSGYVGAVASQTQQLASHSRHCSTGAAIRVSTTEFWPERYKFSMGHLGSNRHDFTNGAVRGVDRTFPFPKVSRQQRRRHCFFPSLVRTLFQSSLR